MNRLGPATLLAWIALAGAAVPLARAQRARPYDEPTVDAREYEPEPDAAPARSPRSAPTRAAVEAALARYAHEPRVEEVVAATERAAERDRAAALAARARTAGWVPRVGLRARRGQTVDLAASQSADQEALRLSTDDDLTLEASLTFELDRVVFRSEEVALAREARAERQARAAIVREVIALYFERRRLQVERDLGAPANARSAARIAEIEALIDVFTNGEFRRMIANARWRTAASTPDSRSPSLPKSSTGTTP